MRHQSLGIVEHRRLSHGSAIGQIRGSGTTVVAVARLNNDTGAADVADEIPFEHHHALLTVDVLVAEQGDAFRERNEEVVDESGVGPKSCRIGSLQIGPLELVNAGRDVKRQGDKRGRGRARRRKYKTARDT